MYRRHWLSIVVVAATVVVAAMAWLVVWTQVVVHQEREVAVPPDDASPAVVVRAYLDSLDAHDCETAVALSVPQPYRDEWKSCRATKSVTDIEVVSQSPRDVEAYVEVSFNMQPRWWSQDFSLVGPTTWTYHLQRSGTVRRWRIDGGGEG